MFKNRKKRKDFLTKSKKINAIDKPIKQCKIHYKTYSIQQLNETDLENHQKQTGKQITKRQFTMKRHYIIMF